MITEDQLAKVMPFGKKRIPTYLPWINQCIAETNMSLDAVRMLIAQLAVESAEFRYVKELASGEAYDTGKKAIQLGNTPEPDSDGQFYKGRGLIQITGKRNYQLVSEALCIDCVRKPEMLEQPEWAVKSAFWYWQVNNLSRYATDPTEENFKRVTKAINGGYNHLKERMEYWERAKKYIDGI